MSYNENINKELEGIKNINLYTFIMLVFGIILNIIFFAVLNKAKTIPENSPKVSLPEEYRAITKEDTLRGYYRNDSLIIEFNNSKNK